MTETNLRDHASSASASTATGAATTGPTSTQDEADLIAIVPVRQFVLFPGVVMPITLKDEAAIAAAQHAVREGVPLGLVWAYYGYWLNRHIEAVGDQIRRAAMR